MRNSFLFLLLLSSIGCGKSVPAEKPMDATAKLLEARKNNKMSKLPPKPDTSNIDTSSVPADSTNVNKFDTVIQVSVPSQPTQPQVPASGNVKVVYITTSQHPITKTDFINPQVPSYTRVKNLYWQQCRYKDFISDLLEAELQYTLSQNKKPISYYSQWFLDLYNPEYTTDDVLKYYEQKVISEIGVLYKTTSINHEKAWQRLPCVYETK